MPFPSFDDIRERKIVQWALAYLTGAWLALQVLNIVGERFGWPDVWLRMLIVALGVGFFGVLVVAWYHGEKGAQRVSGTELVILAVLLLTGGAAVALVNGSSVAPGVTGHAAAAKDAQAAREPPPSVDQAAIAVLPFDNMSADAKQKFFAEGITEEILNALARVQGLRVAARTSSFAFEGQGVSTDSIARALDVAHLVEGSVRKAGNRVRISARLVNAQTGFREWGATFDRKLTDVFEVQNEVGQSVAQALRVRVAGGPEVEQGTDDPEAYAHVLKGRQVLRGKESLRERVAGAKKAFAAALRRDSTYAAAWAGLAAVHLREAGNGLGAPGATAERWKQARAEAQRALALDADEGAAHVVLARIASGHDGDPETALRHYEAALEANPSDAIALAGEAVVLLGLGKREQALRNAQRAVTRAPLSLNVLNTAGRVYNDAGKPAQAVETLRAALELAPQDAFLHTSLAFALATLGKYEEAQQAAQQAVAQNPALVPAQAILAYAYAQTGDRAAAKQALAKVPEQAYFLRAQTQVALGDADAAFALLNRAAEAGTLPAASTLRREPALDPLRDDPRLDRLIEQMEAKKAAAGR